MHRPIHAYGFVLLIGLVFGNSASLVAQTGSIYEPIRYIGGPTIPPPVHDGQLRPAVGVENVQIMRANRTRPEDSDGFGWTYNHAPMIAYWNKRFFVQYLSNPVGEHIAPGQTLVVTSVDGRHWDSPQVVFPIYELQAPDPKGTTAMMHQRMGFYVAPDGRLLVLAFYGHAPNPFREGGIGRVVREAYKDGTYGPIYFIRYNEKQGWNEGNTRYPSYQRSKDKGFVEACDALMNNRLMMEQWWDEERLDDTPGFKGPVQREAFNWYHRKDGKVVGLWKKALVGLSDDDGKTWSPLVKVPTLQITGAKVSGRRTSDGRYALTYCPCVDDDHRWPLAIVTGDDGILFDNMLCIHGEVPLRRFAGKSKDFGPQYNRMVEEGNGSTPGPDQWVTYSMNKEDIWVSRIPVPVRHQVSGDISDTFDGMDAGVAVTDWNIYSPRWSPVHVDDFPNATNKSLKLEDKDPYDYARAVRVFAESRFAIIQFKVRAGQNHHGRLEIDITNQFGHRPVRLSFEADGNIKIFDGGELKTVASYEGDRWYDITIQADVAKGRCELAVGSMPAISFQLTEAVKSIERLSFRTGSVRTEPTLKTVVATLPDSVDPNPDVPEALAVFHIDDVRIEGGPAKAEPKVLSPE